MSKRELEEQIKVLIGQIEYIMSHPLEACKFCEYCDAECVNTGFDCHAKWKGMKPNAH